MVKYTEIAGDKYGRLTAVRHIGYGWWTWGCDCGQVLRAQAWSVVTGRVISCGCYHKEEVIGRQTTHGHTLNRVRSPTFISWDNMWGGNRKHKLGVEPRWQEFSLFLEDMGPRPEGAHLYREDTEVGWDLDNCFWGYSRRHRCVG